MVTGVESGDFWNLACVIINPYVCTAAPERVHSEPELNATVWASEGTSESALLASSATTLVAMNNHRRLSKQLRTERACRSTPNSSVLRTNIRLRFILTHCA